MTQENKNRLLGLLQQHKELGIAEQIDFDKSMTDSLIANSVALVDSDDGTAIDDSERKWLIKRKTQRRISWLTFEELNPTSTPKTFSHKFSPCFPRLRRATC